MNATPLIAPRRLFQTSAAIITASALLVAAPLAAQAEAAPTAVTVEAEASIQAALDLVAPGGVVTLEAATFTEDLRITRPVTLRGTAGTVLQGVRSGKNIDITNTTGVTIENLQLEGNPAVNSTGIDANGVRDLTLRNLEVSDYAKNGIAITNRFSSDSAVTSADITISGVTSADNTWAGLAFYTKSSRGVEVDINNVAFAGNNSFYGNAYNLQFGDPGNTAKVTGAAGGAVSLAGVTVGARSSDALASIFVTDKSTVAATATTKLRTGTGTRAVSLYDLPGGVTLNADSIAVPAGKSIQRALDAVTSGGTVSVAAGTFAEDLNITRPVTLQGAAGGATVLSPVAANKNIAITDVTGVTVRDLTLAGNAVNASGIDANGVATLNLSDLKLSGYAKNGIAITNRFAPTSAVTSRDVTLNNVTSVDNAWAGVALYTRSSQGVNDDINNVLFTGSNTFAGNKYDVQLGDPGNTGKVTGANGGPVHLGAATLGLKQNVTPEQASIFIADASAATVDAAAQLRTAADSTRKITAADLPGGVTLIGGVVEKAKTTLSAVAGSVSVTVNSSVTVTGTVTPAVDGIVSVRIADSQGPVRTVPVVAGAFSVSFPFPTAGTYALAAEFTPSDAAAYEGSSARTATITVTAPVVVAPPAPAADSAGLDRLIAEQKLDVAAVTASFVAPAGVLLDSLNFKTLFSGNLPWAAEDTEVDVFAYSTPLYLGTFPVVNGQVVLTDVDLSALEAGGHRLVFQGKQSGTVAVIAIRSAEGTPVVVTKPGTTVVKHGTTITKAGGSLAHTGSDAGSFAPVIALTLLLGGAAVLLRRRTRA